MCRRSKKTTRDNSTKLTNSNNRNVLKAASQYNILNGNYSGLFVLSSDKVSINYAVHHVNLAAYAQCSNKLYHHWTQYTCLFNATCACNFSTKVTHT